MMCGTNGKTSLAEWDARMHGRCVIWPGNLKMSVENRLRKPELTVQQLVRVEQLVYKRWRESSSSDSSNQHFTFPGFKANRDQSPPKKSKKRFPWRGCVSEDWINKTDCKIKFPEDDESVSILKIRVPDWMFSDEHDAYWLGQVEDDA
jgi:hypothetical protein